MPQPTFRAHPWHGVPIGEQHAGPVNRYRAQTT